MSEDDYVQYDNQPNPDDVYDWLDQLEYNTDSGVYYDPSNDETVSEAHVQRAKQYIKNSDANLDWDLPSVGHIGRWGNLMKQFTVWGRNLEGTPFRKMMRGEPWMEEKYEVKNNSTRS